MGGVTGVVDLGLEVGVVGEGEDGCFDGGDLGGELEEGSLGVRGPDVEAVLKDAVDDSADAKGGLDN